nr:hypothetical protein GCM10025732_21290 [Glycomyces mayteni]
MFECELRGARDGEGEPVDAPGLVGAAVLAEPGAGESFDAVELLAVDGAERAAEAVGAAGLHLADDDGVGGPGDEVEFAGAVAPVAGEDLHAVALQVGGGEPFAEAAEFVRAQAVQVGPCGGRGHDWAPAVRGAAWGRPGRGRRRTLPLPNRSIGSR